MICAVKELFQGRLREYLHQLSPSILSKEVLQVTSDSRKVGPGSVFIALRGETQDGHNYVKVAEESGALLIIIEQSNNHPKQVKELKKPYLEVKDGRYVLSHLAANFYGRPSEKMKMIGVTGTSGKTTTSYLIESVLSASGHRVGVIGTISFRFGSKVIPSTHTTPGHVEIQELLFQMEKEGCTAVVMEVSSHALKQKRVASIAFDGMVFTNLSPEHLDYHVDMEDYFLSKATLFTEMAGFSRESGKRPVGVISDEPYGQRLMKLAQESGHFAEVKFFKFTSENPLSAEGIEGNFSGLAIQSHMIGSFNGSNIAATVLLAQGLGVPEESIQKGISGLRGVPGRLERVENKCGIHIWVDYAHKPDALSKVLQALREVRGEHRLITVFGCGGDRDRTKRPVMGQIAVQLSDFVWITSDNPRTEEPSEIIDEILCGTKGYQNYKVEVDRKKAIIQAIGFARQGDLVLIAGKGHEDYQIVGTQKIHFDDREIARAATER